METIALKERRVGDLVKENIKTAHVFKKYGIDFCCGGGITIEPVSYTHLDVYKRQKCT